MNMDKDKKEWLQISHDLRKKHVIARKELSRLRKLAVQANSAVHKQERAVKELMRLMDRVEEELQAKPVAPRKPYVPEPVIIGPLATSPKRKSEVLKLRKAGLTHRQIARKLQITVGMVSVDLHKNGIGIKQIRQRALLLGRRRQRAYHLRHVEGKSYHEAGKELGVSGWAAKRLCLLYERSVILKDPAVKPLPTTPAEAAKYVPPRRPTASL